jgi:putative oxidoreductase
MTATLPASTRPSKALDISLWIVRALLALAFAMAGIIKSTQPIAELAKNVPWTGVIPAALVRFIGVSELAGGLGLILPAATRFRPLLTPVAATGLLTIMVLAAGESGPLINFTLGALAAFVAWGRFKKAPISPR